MLLAILLLAGCWTTTTIEHHHIEDCTIICTGADGIDYLKVEDKHLSEWIWCICNDGSRSYTDASKPFTATQ